MAPGSMLFALPLVFHQFPLDLPSLALLGLVKRRN
jgi:hypothetical protein